MMEPTGKECWSEPVQSQLPHLPAVSASAAPKQQAMNGERTKANQWPRDGACPNKVLATCLSCGLGGCAYQPPNVVDGPSEADREHFRCCRVDCNGLVLCCCVCTCGFCGCAWATWSRFVHRRLGVAARITA
eukprot:TRINITY_DN44025_c0_g1_i1.p2 TRINITY_DN44025_c0_g1~~TRINITY_DN44025_c0_g1_i1.p2  ORF type:complete len:132 (-),score=19.82 TRINITY_DN44025_c0_g1_i1:136-531(-)